jgi:hypothetical protein
MHELAAVTVLGVVIVIITAAIMLLVPSTCEAAYTPQRAASELAEDYLAPLVAPDTREVYVQVRYCRPAVAGWRGCRVRITGAVTCNAVVRVRVPVRSQYVGWVPWMQCS